MAVTVESFRQAFEEYRKTDQATIEARLSFARPQVNATVWGGKTDIGVMYLTAHLLALAPAGQNAKLKPSDAGVTVYWQEYRRLLRQVTVGVGRLAGLPDLSRANKVIS